MKINGLTYAEISDIRELVIRKRHELWLEFCKANRKKSREELKNHQAEMYQVKRIPFHNELNPISRYSRILSLIQETELNARREYEKP